jgi:hypothetical protein
MVKRGNFNQRSRRVYLTGGCTGRFTKTLKMVKSAYVNLCLHGCEFSGWVGVRVDVINIFAGWYIVSECINVDIE